MKNRKHPILLIILFYVFLYFSGFFKIRDLKSLVRKDVPVRLRPEAPKKSSISAFYPSPFLSQKDSCRTFATLKKSHIK